MKDVPICENCVVLVCQEPCAAMLKLNELHRELRMEEKAGIIEELRQELALVDYEVADDLRELGEKVIMAMPELHIIPDFNIRVGYVRSHEAKQGKGNKAIMADCRKVNGTYTAYLPFDFIVTFYEPNTYHMSENQKKILMLHELKHIGVGEKGFKIEHHDVEDFVDILYRFGIEWNGFDQDVPDILAGGDVEIQKQKQKGKKK